MRWVRAHLLKIVATGLILAVGAVMLSRNSPTRELIATAHDGTKVYYSPASVAIGPDGRRFVALIVSYPAPRNDAESEPYDVQAVGYVTDCTARTASLQYVRSYRRGPGGQTPIDMVVAGRADSIERSADTLSRVTVNIVCP